MKERLPTLTAKVTHVLVGSVEHGAIYRRDPDGWRLVPGEPVTPRRRDEPA